MSRINMDVNISVELMDVLNQANILEVINFYGKEKILQHLSGKGSNIIDFSIINEAVYDRLMDLIDRGTLSLELLLGKIAVRNFTKVANNKIAKTF